MPNPRPTPRRNSRPERMLISISQETKAGLQKLADEAGLPLATYCAIELHRIAKQANQKA